MSQIFEDAGFDVEILGGDRTRSESKRWRKAYKEFGAMGLSDTRKINSGRTLERELTQVELLAKKDAEIAYLRSVVELLKKIELQERQVRNNKLTTSVIFALIQDLIKKHDFKGIVQHLCKTAGVSRSGYYNYLRTGNIRIQHEKKDMELRDIVLKAFNHRGYKKGSRSIKMVPRA